MYRRTACVVVLVGALGATGAQAVQWGADAGFAEGPAAARQAPPEGPPLTIQAALAEALERNPELIALRRQFDAERERPAQERFLHAPTFEAQIWQWPINSINPANTNMYMFMASQEIPGAGKRRLREAVAQKDVDLAETDISVRAREVVERVKRAYAELAFVRKAIEVHHASVDLLRQFADVAQVKYTTGRMSQQDVLKAVVELSRIHDHLIDLDEQVRLAEAQLNTLLDRRPGAPIGPLAELDERVLFPSSETLQELAIEHQPELRRARLGTERAEAQRAVIDRDYRPDFFATAGYMLMPNDRDAWMARIGLTWPTAPWSRGRLTAQRAEATAEVAAAQARVRAVENALRLSVHQAYVRVEAARRRATLLRTTVVPQAEQILEVSRAAYQADRGDFFALIDNERVRLDAQLDYYRALSDLDVALADLERTVGTDIMSPLAAVVSLEGVR